MTGSWFDAVIIGAVVGLLFAVVPLVMDFVRMLGLIRYINMDLVRFQQLLETGDAGALAYPLSQKLSEKGILLSWKTQRELAKLRVICQQAGYPFEPAAYDTLKGSLETYRDTVGMLSGRIGVLAWHPGWEFERPVPPFVAAALRTIDRDWRQFSQYSSFLQRFISTRIRIPTQKE